MKKKITLTTVLVALFILCQYTLFAQDTWEQITPTGDIPSAREGHSMVTIDSLVYLFGGQDNSKSIFNHITVYDPAIQEWMNEEPITQLPPARTGHKAIAYNGKMYVFFGMGSGGALDDVWEYNPQTKEWTHITPGGQQPVARYDHSAKLMGNMVWLFGGQDNNGDALSDLWAYNFSNNQWEQYPSITGGGIYGHIAVEHVGSLYIMGGFRNDLLDNAIYKFFTGNNSWSTQSPQGNYPNPFAYAGFKQFDSEVFIFGGLTDAGTTGNCYKWDITTHQFIQLATGPEVAAAGATIIPHSYDKTNYQKFILFGGSNEGLLNNNTWIYTSYIEITGIESVPIQQIDINIFPNPATDYITIEINEYDLQGNNLYYQLCDLNGRVLTTKNITTSKTTINVENQKSSVFFIRILKENSVVSVFKRMKH